MTISNWPATERPREKLLRHGARVLSDAELVALFLRTGRPGCHAVDLARELLTRHGGLRAFLRCERATLCAHHGFGEAAYALLQGALELSRRSLWERLANGVALGSPADTRTYLRAQLRDLQHEVFACVFLDNRHRVVRFEELFRGTLDGASVYPREVVKRALALNAAAVIFAHNHPSGVAEPSSADTRITTRLRDALALVDIRVLDHIIVGDDEPVSLAERGVL